MRDDQPLPHPDLESYLRERDAVLRDPDLDKLRALLARYGNKDALLASDEVMRTAWHKARTGATSLPREERRASILWLEERGFSHLADDDLDDSDGSAPN